VQDVTLYGHNTRGLSDDKLEELVEHMRERKIYAYAVQETWRTGDQQRESNGFLFVGHGYSVRRCNRGSGGVGFILSPAARKAWEAAGSKVLHFGERIMAIKLQLEDAKGLPLVFFLVSAYAPNGIGPAKEVERSEFLSELAECESACGEKEVWMTSIDANACMGRKCSTSNSALGPFGVEGVNEAGKVVLGFLLERNLCSVGTFFRKRKEQYATWYHPYHRRGAQRVGYQLDHWLVRRKDLKRVRSAWTRNDLTVASDHTPLMMRIRVSRRKLGRKANRKAGRVKVKRVDRQLLRNDKVKAEFVEATVRAAVEKGWKRRWRSAREECEELRDVLDEEIDSNGNVAWDEVQARRKREGKVRTMVWGRNGPVDGSTKEGEKAKREAIAVRRAAIALAPDCWAAQHTAYQLLTECLTTSANEVLTDGDRVRRPEWFEGRKEQIVFAVLARNEAQKAYNEDSSSVRKVALRATRRLVKLEVRKAKEAWLEERIDAMNNGTTPGGGHDPKVVWDMVKELKAGYSTWRKAVTVRLKKSDGSWCEGIMEIAERFKEHFSKVLNIESEFDFTVLELIKQRPIDLSLEEMPSEEEVLDAVRKMKSGKAGDDSNICSEFLKALATSKDANGNSEGMILLMKMVEEFWLQDVVPDEWNSLRLKSLPKGGDLSNVAKWRGIYLMDLCCKLVSKVLERRLGSILKVFGMEAQNGFMAGRGCSDGIFLLYQALLKRREHCQDSWVLLVDLVKAFPSVPRDGMWAVLSKFGVPAHMLKLIKRIHTGVVAKLAAGKVDIEIPNTSGTKQGDPMAAILFLFHMQACLETLDLEGVEFQTPSARFEKINKTMRTTGVRWQNTREWDRFRLMVSLYADDAGLVFDSRAKLQEATERLFSHFKRFGLTMHVGRNGSASKTEAMYFPGAGRSYSGGDTSPLTCDGGTVTFTKSFKYLGSIFASSLRSDEDIEKRLKSAGAAFGALRKCVFGTVDISPRVKGKVYMALIVSILLYGSECWTLTKVFRRKLVSFHRRCVRAMCRVTRKKVWKEHIQNESLLKRLSLRSMDHYINVRILRWAGHVVRMPRDRLPRMLMFSKVRHVRRQGGQLMTYGRRLKGELRMAYAATSTDVQHKLNAEGWMKFARDRAQWRAFCKCVP